MEDLFFESVDKSWDKTIVLIIILTDADINDL